MGVPLLEEIIKTTIALAIKGGIIGSHLVFGLIEGLYDIFTSSKEIGKEAAMASIISHSFFGIVTQVTYVKTQKLIMGIMIAWIFHSTWNWYIVKKL